MNNSLTSKYPGLARREYIPQILTLDKIEIASPGDYIKIGGVVHYFKINAVKNPVLLGEPPVRSLLRNMHHSYDVFSHLNDNFF